MSQCASYQPSAKIKKLKADCLELSSKSVNTHAIHCRHIASDIQREAVFRDDYFSVEAVADLRYKV
jgi:hypothetical protein